MGGPRNVFARRSATTDPMTEPRNETAGQVGPPASEPHARSRRIVSVAPVFPTRRRPERGAFLASLAREISQQAAGLDIVAPRSIPTAVADLFRARVHGPALQFPFRVVRPWYISFSTGIFGAGPMITWLGGASFRAGVTTGLRSCSPSPDWVYCHFFFSALAAQRWSRRFRIPYVVELQESGIRQQLMPYGAATVRAVLTEALCVVTVSRDNERFCLEIDPGLAARIEYIPNAVDLRAFRPLPRSHSPYRAISFNSKPEPVQR